MNKRIFFRQLKVQITSFYLIASLMMVLLMSSAYYYSASSIILEDTLEQTIYGVEQSGNDLDNYIIELKKIAMYISQNDDIKSFLQTGEKNSKIEAHQVIDQALATNSSIVSVVAIGKDGGVVSNETELEMSVSSDMMKESWYVRAIDNQQMPALTSARLQEFTMDKETWVIALSQEIFDDKNNHLGVVLLDIKYQVIEGYLDHLPLGEAGFAFIMDESKQVVYHPDPNYFINGDKKSELISMVENSQGYDKENNLLTHHYSIPNTHWTLVGVSSLDQLALVRRQLIEVLVLLSGIILVVVVGGSYFIANRITRPIKELQSAMKDFDSFETSIKKSSGCYEVESLSKEFDKMLKEIQRLLSEIKENERYLRTYELNALYSQINPHFLYNTLDTIVWMAEFNNSEKVIEVTKSLAQFFRISLSKGQEMITLEEEFDHISQYLFIQKQRYDDQLSYSIDLPENLKSVKVPKIILQPIVENAIYHGIREKTSGGSITVSVQQDASTLKLIVQDDGVGFDEETKESKLVKLGGVGIENVKKRLSLVYGDRSDIVIDSKPNIGTTVTLIIPQN
ncbi:MAG: sensor histidine kinase [Clostridiales bacterium]|nr:sensor histidine kinase [Clostridiales bacterium]